MYNINRNSSLSLKQALVKITEANYADIFITSWIELYSVCLSPTFFCVKWVSWSSVIKTPEMLQISMWWENYEGMYSRCFYEWWISAFFPSTYTTQQGLVKSKMLACCLPRCLLTTRAFFSKMHHRKYPSLIWQLLFSWSHEPAESGEYNPVMGSTPPFIPSSRLFEPWRLDISLRMPFPFPSSAFWERLREFECPEFQT